MVERLIYRRMNLSTIKTPGVYINEITAFPNSVVPVATAVPAFIGYTPAHTYQGKSYLGTPMRISSWTDFLAYFGKKDPADPTGAKPLPDAEQSTSLYHLSPAKVPAQADITLGGQPMSLRPDPATVYYLYNSVKLFYQNGGGLCYIVSVGTCGGASGQGLPVGSSLVNPDVALADLKTGLAALANVGEVTMVLATDALLLSGADYAEYCQAALEHCGTTQSRVAILDIQNGAQPDPLLWENDIQAFRAGVGLNALSYGAAYYPFLKTTIVEADYRNLAAPAEMLRQYLAGAGSAPLAAVIARIDAPQGMSPTQIEQALQAASAEYRQLSNVLSGLLGVLPPSGAMAGLYTKADSERGVWTAPANMAPLGVTDVTLRLNASQHELLNDDAATGKSINALRFFAGLGVLVWGARTLDGNSMDWRYIQVRRTIIYIEQSIKLALQPYAFEPNVATTWMAIKSMLESFLTGLWQQGGLQGSAAKAAFNVSVGLGTTMTAQDILNGEMRVTVEVAVSHPAEFIVLTFVQKMGVGS